MKVNFILDPCSIPEIYDLCKERGNPMIVHISYITRTYAYYMHRAKMISLGRWPAVSGRKKMPMNHTKLAQSVSLNKQFTNNSYVAGTPDTSQIMTTCTSTTVHYQYQHSLGTTATNAAICPKLFNFTASAAAGEHLCGAEAEQGTNCVTRGNISTCGEPL